MGGILTLNARGPDSIPGQETGSHMLQVGIPMLQLNILHVNCRPGAAKKKKKKVWCKKCGMLLATKSLCEHRVNVRRNNFYI